MGWGTVDDLLRLGGALTFAVVYLGTAGSGRFLPVSGLPWVPLWLMVWVVEGLPGVFHDWLPVWQRVAWGLAWAACTAGTFLRVPDAIRAGQPSERRHRTDHEA